MLLKDFIKNLNFDEMKEKHLGYYFCIDFDHKGNRDCWFNKTEDDWCFGCIKITKEMTGSTFMRKVEEIQQAIKEIDKIGKIQRNLTIDSERYRTIFLNNLNYLLIKQGLKAITITKYKNMDEVFKEIKQINDNNSKLGFFLNLLKGCNNLEVFLLQNKCKYYYTNIYYTEDDVIIDTISVPIEKILSEDVVLYQLSTQACKDIMNDEYDYHQFATWDLYKRRKEMINNVISKTTRNLQRNKR